LLATALAVVALLVVMAPAASAAPATRTSYVFAECIVGVSDDSYRDVGNDGHVHFSAGVLVWDVYLYDASGGWYLAGTDTNPSWDHYNDQSGREVFRGKFNFSATIGDFAGTFTWMADPSGFGGRSAGRATDGSGVLWKATLGGVDPAPYEPLPACATGFAYLNELELTTP
jgi:hypothetical protein